VESDNKKMKAIVCTKSGPPEGLQLKEVLRPEPGDKDVLIKVVAATVTRGDVILRKMHPLLALLLGIFGVKRQKIPGVEFAGDISAAGKDVKQFKVGDKVFGTTTGLRFGANAEFVCVPEHGRKGVVALMPNNATYEEAAALPVGGMTALYLLRKTKIKPGGKILVYGASGSVGTYAVQMARYAYDARVTGVCSTMNVDLVKSLGAEKVIDYTREEILQSGQTFDVIFDAVGKLSTAKIKSILTGNGTYLSIRRPTKELPEDLLALKALFEEGKIKPVIDRRYTLVQVPEAHMYVETGRKKGNVIISVVDSESGGNV
jgi:NADPH:quinone reductase-like Zn-dependent oxidoreductase